MGSTPTGHHWGERQDKGQLCLTDAAGRRGVFHWFQANWGFRRIGVSGELANLLPASSPGGDTLNPSSGTQGKAVMVKPVEWPDLDPDQGAE